MVRYHWGPAVSCLTDSWSESSCPVKSHQVWFWIWLQYKCEVNYSNPNMTFLLGLMRFSKYDVIWHHFFFNSNSNAEEKHSCRHQSGSEPWRNDAALPLGFNQTRPSYFRPPLHLCNTFLLCSVTDRWRAVCRSLHWFHGNRFGHLPDAGETDSHADRSVQLQMVKR